MRNTSRFLTELSSIAPKFDWFYVEKIYKNGMLALKEIRGVKKGGDFTAEYTPITAVVESLTGRYFEMDRFDMAANEIQMSPECAVQILDACDDWPDRLHGYSPKGYELKLRDEITNICFGK